MEPAHEFDQPPVDTSATTALTRDSGAIVKYHHCAGVRNATGRCLDHLSDDTIVYLAGRHVAAYQHETSSHRFILKNPKSTEIVTFCVSPNRKYIALAEKLAEGGLQVNIYTQHTGSKVRCLDYKFLSKLPVVAMDFSTDNKYLVTVTSLPDVHLHLWQVDKCRLIGMVDVPFEITRVTVSPWAYYSLCSTGPGTLRLWRLVEKQLKPIDPTLKRKDPAQLAAYRFTSHAWYDDEKVVAGTAEGDIVVVETGEVKKVLRGVHGEGYSITAVCNMARGFLCGGDGGIISFFERTFDDSTYFRLLRRFQPYCHSRVVEISIAPKEESAAIVYSNNTVAIVSLEHIDLLREAASANNTHNNAAPNAAPAAESQYHALPIGFHNDTVTCVDVCVQKSLLITGSVDKTIRVWNFMRRRVEFTSTFDEEVLSLALHPMGLRVVVGFKSCMRMYNVLSHDLHFCSEFPVKPCYEVRFSNGGHCFAAVVVHRILLFNTYDFQCFGQLAGHTVLVKSIAFSRNDQVLITSDVHGVVYTWDVETQKRNETDESRKSVFYSCVKYDETTQSVAAVGVCRLPEAGLSEGETLVRMLQPNAEPRTARPNIVTKQKDRKSHTSEMALSLWAQTMFVGAPGGVLLLYAWPLADDAAPYQRLEVHSSDISFVVLSHDERYLFTIGDDNVMYMFEVDAIVEGRAVTRKAFNYAAFDDVCYVLQSELDDKSREITALQEQLTDLQTTRAREEQNIIQRYELERTTREEEATSTIASLQRQLSAVTKDREDTQKAMTEHSQQVEAMHLRAAEELEAMYSKRSEEAANRYQALKTERDDLVVRYENRIYKLTKEHEAERRRLEERTKEMEAKLVTEIETLKKRAAEERNVAESMLDQTIVDYESIIDDVNSKQKQELAKKDEDLSKAINNGSTGERDTERLRKERHQLLQQLTEKDEKVAELESLLEKRKKENESLKKEMLVRYESISAAEKKIQQLKKQTTELEKLRYVLTFKFNELKKEVAPKDKQITFMTSRVQEMDSELDKVANDREALRQLLTGKEEKLMVLQREAHRHIIKLEDKKRLITTLMHELSELVADADTRRLVYKLRDIVSKYGEADQEDHFELEEDRTGEFERQREYMEAQLSCVKRQNRQKESNMQLENQRNTSENAILVREINELRHEKKILLTKCQVVEGQLKEARVALQRVTSTTPGLAGTAPARATTPLAEKDPHSLLPASRRGKIVRGPTRALRDIAQLDSDKIAHIIAQVERNNAEMERQQLEIARLREFVAHLLSRAESERLGVPMSNEEAARHEEIRKHLATTMTPAPAMPSSSLPAVK